MTLKQEIEEREQYLKRAEELLHQANDSSYRKLCSLCKEPKWHFLMKHDREMRCLFMVMYLWDRETANGRSIKETIIGCSIRMQHIPAQNLSVKHLNDVYTTLRFTIFRLESTLPHNIIMDGIEKILELGLSPEAVILGIENESLQAHDNIKRLIDCLSDQRLLQLYPSSGLLRDVLSDYQEWSEKRKTP